MNEESNKEVKYISLDRVVEEWKKTDFVTCERCGDKIKRGVISYTEHFYMCNGATTEDAEFEIIQPKQIENGKAD